jgi:hypothetical protein
MRVYWEDTGEMILALCVCVHVEQGVLQHFDAWLRLDHLAWYDLLDISCDRMPA